MMIAMLLITVSPVYDLATPLGTYSRESFYLARGRPREIAKELKR